MTRVWPVALYRGQRAVITQHYKPGGTKPHRGDDFAFATTGQEDWPEGTTWSDKTRKFAGPPDAAIVASAGGFVERAFWQDNGGRVDIREPDGTLTSYLHLANIHVKPGMWANAGHVLGIMGGGGGFIHLHYARRDRHGAWIDPEPELTSASTRAGTSTQEQWWFGVAIATTVALALTVAVYALWPRKR